MDFVTQFLDARRVSVPLVGVKSPDHESTIEKIKTAIGDPKVPYMSWDVIRGLVGLSAEGKREVARLCGEPEKAKMATMRPANMLEKLQGVSEDAVVFMCNPQLYWSGTGAQRDPAVIQGIWNLRGPFKTNGRMLVMLGTAGMEVPVELSDICTLDEPYPTEKELWTIIEETYSDAMKRYPNVKKPSKEEIKRIIDAVIGLPAFPAEQAIAMALSKNGMDHDLLWERKRQTIERTRGLSVWRGGERFAEIGGLDNAKEFFRAVLRGRRPPGGVVFLDEMEKGFAGSGTDLSGVKTAMEGIFLTWMQDRNARGAAFVGPPGTGKTNLAKAIGAEGNLPTICLDFSGMQSSLIGSSEENLRTSLKTIEAVCPNPLVIGSMNRIEGLSSAIRRRLNLGVFFFDLPTPKERDVIWDIYLKKYDLEKTKLPNDWNWTGAEIKNCCENASNLGMSLEEAAGYVVPVAVSDEEGITRLRTEANRKYISASKPGKYIYKQETPEQTTSGKRKFRVIDMDIDSFSDKVGQA